MAFAVVSAVVVLPIAGADPVAPVRVYTNSDLSLLGPPPAPPTQPIPGSSLEWVDLEGFLERQYARIDADRRNDLERREAERRDRLALAADTERYWLPDAGYWPVWGSGYPYQAGGGWDDSARPCGGARHMPDRPKRWSDLAGGKPAGGGGRPSPRARGHRASGR